MENTSEIKLMVALDEDKIPKKIEWLAAAGGVDKPTEAKAFLLSIWDGNEQSALRIDLWTKDMMVNEMNDFFFQTFMTMADTFDRATNRSVLAESIKTFGIDLKKKMNEAEEKDLKL